MNNLPEKEGVYEWFTETGKRVLILVCDFGSIKHPYLRVYMGASYYNIKDEKTGVPEHPIHKAEWTSGTWGKYMGKEENFKESELCLLHRQLWDELSSEELNQIDG